MIQEKLILKETAKLAKESGFDIPCAWYFNDTDKEPEEYKGFKQGMTTSDYNQLKDVEIYSLPTQALLQTWLRESHEINVFIYCYAFGYYPIHDNTPPPNKEQYVDKRWNLKNTLNYQCKTYEEALEIGLFEALKVINKL